MLNSKFQFNLRKIVVFAFLFMVMLSPSFLFSEYWDMLEVDKDSYCGSIAMDSNDTPHVGYSAEGALKYAKWSGSTWNIQTIVSQDVGYVSLAIDSSDNPHLCYTVDGALKYAKWDGLTWNIQTIIGHDGKFSSIAIDSNDIPHMIYYDSITRAIKYIYWNGSLWDIQIVESIVGSLTSLSFAVDSQGIPHINYINDRLLKYAKWDGLTWNIQIVDSYASGPASLDVDSSDNPHIFFGRNQEGYEYFSWAYWNGTSWIIQHLEKTLITGIKGVWVAVDKHDYPHVLVYSKTTKTGGISLRKWNGSSWDFYYIDYISLDYGWCSSIAIDSNDETHIVFNDYYRKLIYAHLSPSPTISSLSPNSGPAGTEVTINGSNFGKSQGSVTFDGINASILSWSVSQIKAVVPDGANTGPVVVTSSGEEDSNSVTFTVTASPPVISLNRFSLFFGSFSGGATQSQEILISNAGEGELIWTISENVTWLSCTPSSGTGTTVVNVSVDAPGLGAGTYAGTITITDPNASNSPQTVNVTLKVYAAGSLSPPFGFFDTPSDEASVYGSVPVTGWALDDIEVTLVEIKRAPHAEDSEGVIGPDGLVYIGDAVFVEGARPDVEAAYPTYPLNYRAGWGYMMLTFFLPNSGNGTFRIHAIAYDKEGHSVKIGTKTITCDNAHATLPFGAIDTPAQGGTWSGTQVNFGWALTPMPKSIPIDGSTILLWIDGLPIGNPTYNNYRSDIATLFPGFANSNGAVGYYHIDTTQYANGVHTIAWSVEDSAGQASAIGSRYFTVVNTGTGSATGLGETLSLTSQSKTYQAALIADQANIPTDYISPVRVKKGYNLEALVEVIFPDANGVINIEAQEIDRIEIALSENAAGDGEPDRVRGREKSARMSDQTFVGYLVVVNQLRPLPIGSFLDSGRGVFSWQLGPGFVGEYNFVFMIQDQSGIKNKKNIRVRILPANLAIK